MRLGLHSSRRESLRGGGGVDGLAGGRVDGEGGGFDGLGGKALKRSSGGSKDLKGRGEEGIGLTVDS